MLPIIILMGPPGSGKGTQAKKLATFFNLQHISTGELLRALAKDENATKVDKQSLEAMKQGDLVSDDLIYKLAFQAIKKSLDDGRGVVLDGAIRSVKQAEKYSEFFEDESVEKDVHTFVLDLPNGKSFERLTNRRVCKICGAIVPWLPETKDLTQCVECGGELAPRSDDAPAVIKERVKEQGNEAMQPVIDYLRKSGVVKHIDGTKNIEEVWLELKKEYSLLDYGTISSN